MDKPQWAIDALDIATGLHAVDLDIDETSDKLKGMRKDRERLIMELRDTVRRQDEPMLIDQPEVTQ